jgi:hypothetical protein
MILLFQFLRKIKFHSRQCLSKWISQYFLRSLSTALDLNEASCSLVLCWLSRFLWQVMMAEISVWAHRGGMDLGLQLWL